MASLVRSRGRVKPHRVSPREPGRFGEGILRSLPVDRLPVTLQDLQDAAEMFADDAESDFGEDAYWDALADEWAMRDRIERGVLLM